MRKIYRFLNYAFYPIFFILMCYSLSDDVLVRSQFFNDLVNYFKPYIRALSNFEINSKYPGQFQVAYLFAFFLLPLQYFFLEKSGELEGPKKKMKDGGFPHFSLVLFMLFISLHCTLFWYGGGVDGEGKYQRGMRMIMSSKIYYSLFSSVILISLGVILSVAFLRLKFIIKKYLTNAKKSDLFLL